MTEDKRHIDELIDLSRTVAWSRYRAGLPVSYQSRVTREAFEAGFAAGLKFARAAIGESLDRPIRSEEESNG